MRTRAVRRSLRAVEAVDPDRADELLQTEADDTPAGETNGASEV